jgi:hypothetical protein
MARRLCGWHRGRRPRLPIRLKLNHPPLTRLDFFLFFFFLDSICTVFFPVLTHTQGSGQLGFHSLFTVWAWTVSWVLYNLHTHTYNIWHLHGVETHTHTTVGACQYLSPLVNIYNLLAAGEPTNNGDDFNSITTIGAQTKLSSERYTSVSVDNKEMWAVPAGWYISNQRL